MNYKRIILFAVLSATFTVFASRFRNQDERPRVDFTGMEQILTLDYGDGEKAYVMKEKRDLVIQMTHLEDGKEVSGTKSTQSDSFTSSNQAFAGQREESMLAMMINMRGSAQAGPQFLAGIEAHKPYVGVSDDAKYKQLRINGQPVDGIHEYVDDQGKTWYLWYYRDLQLKASDNSVTFE